MKLVDSRYKPSQAGQKGKLFLHLWDGMFLSKHLNCRQLDSIQYAFPSVFSFWFPCKSLLSLQPQEGYLMVQQFQYLGWASHREVPGSKRSFLKLILQVEKWQEECEEGEGRTIIHCLWVKQSSMPWPCEGPRVHFLICLCFTYVKNALFRSCQTYHRSSSKTEIWSHEGIAYY